MQLSPKFHQTEAFKKFWQQGNGKEMIAFSGAQPSLEGFEKYAHLYYHTDLAGDAAARETLMNMSFPAAMRMITAAAGENISQESSLPPGLKHMLLQMQQEPAWLNRDLLERGAELCRRAGLNALIVLRDFTLMGGYNYAYLNKPLIFTEALKKGAVKRLTDTLDFWVNVTRQDALNIHGKGYAACVKTRVIHAYSRLMIQEMIQDWDTREWGKPINSWDMIATYIGFSLTFLLGLKKLNVRFSAEEEAGVFHLWKYIGYLLGIPAAYIPENAKDATAQFYLWTSIQPVADADSVMLAHALLNESLESTIYKYRYQRKRLRYLHICCNWFLLDKETNKRLNIPDVAFKKLFPSFLRSLNRNMQKLSREAQLKKGHNAQLKVLADYLRTAPEHFSA